MGLGLPPTPSKIRIERELMLEHIDQLVGRENDVAKELVSKSIHEFWRTGAVALGGLLGAAGLLGFLAAMFLMRRAR